MELWIYIFAGAVFGGFVVGCVVGHIIGSSKATVLIADQLESDTRYLSEVSR